MARSEHPLRWRVPAAIVAGAALFAVCAEVGGAGTVIALPVQVDLGVESIAPASVHRGAAFTVVETVTSEGPEAAPAKLVVVVDGAVESIVAPEAGLTCLAPLADATSTGFTQVCTTEEPLAPGEVRSVELTLLSSVDPAVTSVRVGAAVGFEADGHADPNPEDNWAPESVALVDPPHLAVVDLTLERMFMGAGAAPMLQDSLAWGGLEEELRAAADSFGRITDAAMPRLSTR